ncbi:MAG: metalloregulator ArsR/SmtB family transcription factor [Coriobacteriaceae bacterium]|nr:metalloregulator ArsR/SmtB family transcription factor [Coriobacteriaceae bacterium]
MGKQATKLGGESAGGAIAPDDLALFLCSLDSLPADEILYDLADLFRMFSDTTRVKILYTLVERERPVGEIAEATGSSQSAVSHQLRTLRQARLVKFRREGRSILYSLADGHVTTILNQGMSHVLEFIGNHGAEVERAAAQEQEDHPAMRIQRKEATMRKSFKLDEIDCASCAQKLEDVLSGVEGVSSVKVNFLTQKLTLEADEDSFDEVLDRVVDTVEDIEPDCAVLV